MQSLTKLVLVTIACAALAACTVGSDGGATVAAPTGLSVGVMNGGAHLTWTDNATDETDYMVMRMEGANAYQTIAMLPANAALYHDGAVTAGVEYMYMVMVMNASSEAESDEVVFTLP